MKKAIVTVLAVSLAVSLTGCGLPGNSEIGKVTQRGMTALEKGEYQTALEAFDEALDLGAKRDTTKELYEMLSNYTNAEKAFEEGNYRLAEEYLNSIDEDYMDYDTFRKSVRSLEKKIDQEIDKQRQEETNEKTTAAEQAASAAAKSAAAAEQAAANAASQSHNPPPAPHTSAGDTNRDGYLFASDREYLTVGYLNTLDNDTIDLIRNEIYARHGYIFQTQKFINYFNAQSWYVPSVPASSFDTSVFNSVERANLDLLIEYQGL